MGSAAPASSAVPRLEVAEVAELGTHATAWDQLAIAGPLPSPFLLSWWLGAQAIEDVDARFVLVTEGTRLLGGLAVRVDHPLGVRRVRLLGAGPLAPDHLDLVAAPDRRADCLGAVARWFMEVPTFVDLHGIASEALVVRALPAQRLITDLSAAPYIPLPRERGAPVAPVRRTRDLRKQSRRLERAGARYRVVDGVDATDFERALAHLRSLHVQLWGDQSGFARGFTAFAEAARAGARDGAVRIHELVADGDVVASEVSLDVAGRRCRYQVGRSLDHQWRGAGNALLVHVIRGAAADGCEELDFLRGREPYKYDWTAAERSILRARAAHGRPASLLLRGLAQAERARPAARRLKARFRARRARRRTRPA